MSNRIEALPSYEGNARTSKQLMFSAIERCNCLADAPPVL